MTRFWITLTQGVNFVLSSMELSRGGEIFVPKIPSTTIAGLASLIGPKLGQRIVGIRPGEKLHETMIPADDSRWTVELEDRYVILASFAAAARDAYLNRGAKPVDEGFAYSSDTNPDQLDARGFVSCSKEPMRERSGAEEIANHTANRFSALWTADHRRRRYRSRLRSDARRFSDHRPASRAL